MLIQAACCGAPYTSTLGIESMADPRQSFRDFERAGWEDARVVELYEQHLSRITTQSIGALLDTAGVRSGMRLLDVDQVFEIIDQGSVRAAATLRAQSTAARAAACETAAALVVLAWAVNARISMKRRGPPIMRG